MEPFAFDLSESFTAFDDGRSAMTVMSTMRAVPLNSTDAPDPGLQALAMRLGVLMQSMLHLVQSNALAFVKVLIL